MRRRLENSCAASVLGIREVGFAVLHLGHVVVADKPLAAGKRRDRIDHDATVGAGDFAGLDVTGPYLGKSRSDIAFPLVLARIVHAVVAIDVHQRSEWTAYRNVGGSDLPDVVECLVDHLHVHRGVEQHDPHLQRIERALQVGDEQPCLFVGAGGFLLLVLEIGDVGRDADDAAIVGAHLAMHDPAAFVGLDRRLPLRFAAAPAEHLLREIRPDRCRRCPRGRGPRRYHATLHRKRRAG